MPENIYKICNMLIPRNGIYVANYKIDRVEDYAEAIKRLYSPQTSISVKTGYIDKDEFGKAYHNVSQGSEKSYEATYGTHSQTGIAKINSDVEKTSYFDKNKKFIFDICLFYQFLTGYNACLQENFLSFNHRNKSGFKVNIPPPRCADDDHEPYAQLFGLLNALVNKQISLNIFNTSQDLSIFKNLLASRDSQEKYTRFSKKFLCFESFEPKPRTIRRFTGYFFVNFGTRKFLPLQKMEDVDFIETIRIIRNQVTHEAKLDLLNFVAMIEQEDKERCKKPLNPQITTKFIAFVKNLTDAMYKDFFNNTLIVMDFILTAYILQKFALENELTNFNQNDINKVIKYFADIYG